MTNRRGVGKFPGKPTSRSQSNVLGRSPGGEGSGRTRDQLWFRDSGMALPQQPSPWPEEAVALLKTGSKDRLRVLGSAGARALLAVLDSMETLPRLRF